MSKQNRLLGLTALIGEMLLLIGAVAWMPIRNVACWVFSAGALLFLMGRILGPQGDWAKSANYRIGITLRRLYGMHLLGGLALVVSAVAMWIGGGFHFGIYLSPSFWLLPFVLFVIIELYTSFRIPAEEKKSEI